MKMKRLKYVSRFAKEMTRGGIDELVAQASTRNRSLQITGVLVTTGEMFFQILEGPEESVDEVYRAIVADERHTDVLLLNAEEDVPDRIFPDWSMRKVSLDGADAARLEPLRAILETVIETRGRLERLTSVLERSVWAAVVDD